MDAEKWMIIGGIVLLVFVASLFKSGSASGDTDYDRRVMNDVGVDASGSTDSDSGSSGDD